MLESRKCLTPGKYSVNAAAICVVMKVVAAGDIGQGIVNFGSFSGAQP